MLQQWDVQHELLENLQDKSDEEIYLYMDTQYYSPIETVNFGYIDSEKYTIIPQ